MKAVRLIAVAVLAITSLNATAFGSLVMSAAGAPEFQRLRWKSRTIKIGISTSLTRPNVNIKYGTDVMAAIERSIQAWQAAADIQIATEVSERQSVSPSGVAGDGVSLITIAQSPENVLFFSKDSDSASAKTRIFFNRSGYITEADIVLNPFQQFSSDGTFGTFDLEATLTHEIGHLLGLRHSSVLGATMADSFARMGTFGLADLGPRTLAESDVAAVRDLYPLAREADDCCAAVSGKLIVASGRAISALRVWAEEDGTGRVIGQTETAADGTFALGGLPAGKYSLFWKTPPDAGSTALGQLGTVRIDAGESRVLSEKIVIQGDALSTDYVGLNGQIADLGLPVTGGRSFVIYLGGRNLDPANATVEFNSPYLTVSPNTTAAQEFSKRVSVISFIVNVHPNTPRGEYTIFLAGDKGLRACLIGGLSVE